MNITLNNKQYLLKSPPSISRASRFPPAVRADVEEKRSQSSPIPEIAFADLEGGAGRSVWRNDKKFHIATANTMWKNWVTPPLKVKQAVVVDIGPTDTLKAQVEFGGVTYAFFVRGAALYYAKWDGETWTKFITPVVASGVSAVIKAMSVGTRIFVLYTLTTNVVNLSHTTDPSVEPATWTVVTLSSEVKTPADMSILESAERLFITGQDATTAGNLTVRNVDFTGGDLSAQWLSLSIKLGTGGVATEIFLNSAGQDALFIGLSYAVYVLRVDGGVTAPQKPILAIDLVESPNNCKVLRKFGAAIYVPTNDMGLLQYQANGTITPMGLDQNDGLPLDNQGYIVSMLADRYFLWAGVKATAKSGIWVWDTDGWHNIWLDTTNSDPSDLAIAGTTKPALLFCPTAGKFNYIRNFHTNPVNLSDSEYETEGYIDYPKYGGDLPERLGTFYGVGVFAENLLGDARYIDVYYKKDDDTDWTFLGRISDTVRYLPFTKGLVAYTIQPRLKLLRGLVATDAPHLHYPIISVSKGESLISVTATIQASASKDQNELTLLATTNEVVSVELGSLKLNCSVQGATWIDDVTSLFQLKLVEV